MESWDGGLRPGKGQGEAGDRPPWYSTTVPFEGNYLFLGLSHCKGHSRLRSLGAEVLGHRTHNSRYK